ncbi:MAG: lipopolysaccharide kinase InaA family protein [Gemmatimonadota bacterium]
MNLALPIWMRADFVVRETPGSLAIVRKDFLEDFQRLELVQATRAGEWPVMAAAGPVSGWSSPPAGGRGWARTFVSDALGEVVVRPIVRGGLPGRWLRTRHFQRWRAPRELLLTERLRLAGVPVPEAVAAVRSACFPGYRSLFVTRRLPGLRAAGSLLREAGPAECRDHMRSCGASVRRLHEAGAWHADLHIDNLLLDPDPAGVPAALIDLDRARLLPPPLPAPLARRNLARLRTSLHRRNLTEAARAWGEFEQAYAARSAGGVGAEQEEGL